MASRNSKFDELGLKVRRAQVELEAVRGVGTVDGVTVEVDAENQLVSLNVPGAEVILGAYREAVRDKQPKVEQATREVLNDASVGSVSTFVDANRADSEAARRATDEAENQHWEELRNDPLHHHGERPR